MSGFVIINADDLGLTEGVNRGIFEAVDAGVVTDVSVMANGAAFEHGVRGLHARGMTGVGLHFCAVDDELALCKPTPLTSGDGRFVNRNVLFVRVLTQPRLMGAAIADELDAQHKRIVDAGLVVTHLDSHQHVHLFPVIAEAVVDFCRRRSIPALRLTSPKGLRSLMSVPMRVLSWRLRRVAAARGVRVVEALGFGTGGRTTRATLAQFIAQAARLPVCEVIVHPGRTDAHARARYAHWHYDWDRELGAILSSRDLITSLGKRLISYRDLKSRLGAGEAPGTLGTLGPTK